MNANLVAAYRYCRKFWPAQQALWCARIFADKWPFFSAWASESSANAESLAYVLRSARPTRS